MGSGLLGHLDCSTGVSGDKFLGALLDAGADGGVFTAEHLEVVLAHLAPEARVRVERVGSRGVSSVSVSVAADGQPHARTWADIRSLLATADVPEPVSARALRAFELLAHAEAKVHGGDPDEVHFHEVGALDSILDVVGVCLGVHALGLERLSASAIATGWGTVDTSHGALPVPAPATAEMLVDVPVVPGPARPDGTAPGELTTPTGIALVRTLATEFGPCPAMTPRRIGYGAGTRDIGHPNVCRLVVGEPAEVVELKRRRVSVLETNVDHLSPEAVAVAAEQLLAEGALDVWTTPIVMKKGRSAVTLSVLAASSEAERLAGRTVALTGTLGIRVLELERFEAERGSFELDTAWGLVRVKVGPEGAASRLRPEADDVARVARESGRSFSVVLHELTTRAEAEFRSRQ